MDNSQITETEENQEDISLEGDYLPVDVRQHIFTDLQQLADFIKLTNVSNGDIQSGVDRKNNRKVYVLALK